MKFIKEIEVFTENCDSFIIPENELIDFEITGIYTTISRIANNAICEITRCEYIKMAFNPKILERSTYFGGKLRTSYEDNITIKDALYYQNITSINIIYEDETKKEIHVAWNDSDEYSNNYQRNKYLSDKTEIIIMKKEDNDAR